MEYLVKTKTETITQNTVLQPEGFGGWQCVNTGTSTCTVNGFPLLPGAQVIGLDFTDEHPNVKWGEPIRIVFSGGGTNSLIIQRKKYSEIKY